MRDLSLNFDLDLQFIVRSIQRRLADLREKGSTVEVIAMDHVVWTLFREAAEGRWHTRRPTLFGHPVIRDVTVHGWAVRVMR